MDRLYKQLLVVLIMLIMSSQCTNPVEETHEDSIMLTGKVVDQNGVGIPNIVAKIEKLNLVDTTDSNGEYSFILSSDSLKSMGVDLGTLKDRSVTIYNKETAISGVEVTRWTDTLPQVQLSIIWKQLNTKLPGYMDGEKVFWETYNDSVFFAVQSGSEYAFYKYDQNYVPQPLYNKIKIPSPVAFFLSKFGEKYLITKPFINYWIYKEQNGSFIFKDSLDEVINFPGFTTLDNSTLCISSVRSDILTISSYYDAAWTKKSIDLSSSSGQPIVSALVSIGNVCYIAVSAEKKQPFLYKFDGDVISSINIGNYQSFNYLSVNRDGDDLYICGNYYGNNDSIYTFIHKYSKASIEPVVTNIGGLYSKTTGVKTITIDKRVADVISINSTLFVCMNQDYLETMRDHRYSSFVFRLSNGKLEQVGSEVGGVLSWTPLWTPIKLFKKNDKLFLIAGKEGSVYRLE